MYDEDTVLCAASAYTKQYYLNPDFESLPQSVQEDLQIMCVLFTEDVGGTLLLRFDEDGSLLFETSAAEEDLLYDEVGSGLKVRELQQTQRELLESLEMYYRVFFLGEEEEE